MNLIPKHMEMPIKPRKSTMVEVKKDLYTTLDILKPEEFAKFVSKLVSLQEAHSDCHVSIYADSDDDVVSYTFYKIEEIINPKYDVEYENYLNRCKLKVECDNHNEVVTLLRKLYDKISADSSILLEVKQIVG